MTRKLILFFVFLLVFSGFAFSQEAKAKNAIALYPRLGGIEVSYERMLSSHFSFLIDGTYRFMGDYTDITVSGKGRWYPFSMTFHLELGLGYYYGNGAPPGWLLFDYGMLAAGALSYSWSSDLGEKNLPDMKGNIFIMSGIGWKIDIGKPDAFFLPIGLGFGIFRNPRYDEDDDMKWLPLPYFIIGLGYAF